GPRFWVPTPATSTLFPYTTLFRSGYARLVIEMTGVDEAVRSDLDTGVDRNEVPDVEAPANEVVPTLHVFIHPDLDVVPTGWLGRSEEHTSELQSRENLVCRLLLEK